MITWIDVPGCEGTVANGVAADGTVVGVAKSPSGRVRGFVAGPRDDVPRLVDAGPGDTFLQGAAAGGLIIGDFTEGKGSVAFVIEGSARTPLLPPGAVAAWAGGILDTRDCCGARTDASGRRSGFRRLAGRFDEIMPAGAESAVLHGMGEGGEVVGACSLGGSLSGFLQRPDGRVDWLDPPRGAFVPTGCADDGAWITGYFVDDEGLASAGELRDGRWRRIEIPEGPWLESAIIGCRPGVGLAGWVLGGDGRKRGFLLDEPGA